MRKEAKIKSENVGHFYENIISKPFIKLLNKLIKEDDASLFENVLHFLNEPQVVKSVYLPQSLFDAAMKIARQELGVDSFCSFIRLLLIVYVSSHQTRAGSDEEKEDVEDESKPKCFIVTCNEEAVGFLKSPKMGKIFPVCKKHFQECLESGWLLAEEKNVRG